MSERRKPISFADAKRVCYLRLLGIAERDGRSRRCLRFEMLTPSCAVGAFQVGARFVVVAFDGERHWLSTALTEAHAHVEFMIAMGRLDRQKTSR